MTKVNALPPIRQPDRVVRKARDWAAADYRHQTQGKIFRNFTLAQLWLFSELEMLKRAHSSHQKTIFNIHLQKHRKRGKFHVGLETTVFCFYPTRMPQVLGRSPAPSCGLSSPNRPIVMKESVLLKKHGTKQMEIPANDANSCFPLRPIKRN